MYIFIAWLSSRQTRVSNDGSSILSNYDTLARFAPSRPKTIGRWDETRDIYSQRLYRCINRSYPLSLSLFLSLSLSLSLCVYLAYWRTSQKYLFIQPPRRWLFLFTTRTRFFSHFFLYHHPSFFCSLLVERRWVHENDFFRWSFLPVCCSIAKTQNETGDWLYDWTLIVILFCWIHSTSSLGKNIFFGMYQVSIFLLQDKLIE